MDQELIRKARRTDLAEFLLAYHPDAVKRTGSCVYLREYDSVYTRFGFCGYTRFSTGEKGNSIDLLVRYLGYDFKRAVEVLTSSGMPNVSDPSLSPSSTTSHAEAPSIQYERPQPDEQPYKRVVAYLLSRGIPEDTIRMLLSENLLYQEKGTGNAVFISRNQDFCELRGTIPGVTFHGIRRKYPNCFWSMKSTSGRVERAYICEGAIDAISLSVLHAMKGTSEAAAYVGIGGVTNQQPINRISKSVETIIAVDNDKAGQICREANARLQHIIPVYKDWNEDLQHLAQKRHEIPTPTVLEEPVHTIDI
ncbi:MAG: toprim domain-containing protein [Clostridia bacterium]|nr:toprim domain-containing protein [Clostridia bacterium]